MAIQIWDSHTMDELETKFIDTLNNEQSTSFIKYVDNIPVGFDAANRIICFKKASKDVGKE